MAQFLLFFEIFLKKSKIIIEGQAGHHFWGEGDLQVIFHCKIGSRSGYYCVRKRLRDRAAFNYDPQLGWETDRWFEWPEDFPEKK